MFKYRWFYSIVYDYLNKKNPIDLTKNERMAMFKKGVAK